MNDARNELGPPITDLRYGLALAMESVLSSYDYIVSQPTVLSGEEAAWCRQVIDGRPPGPRFEP